MNLKENGKLFTSKSVGTGPSSYEKKKNYQAAVSQRLRNIVIECTYTNLDNIAYYTPSLYGIAYCYHATNLYSMLLY